MRKLSAMGRLPIFSLKTSKRIQGVVTIKAHLRCKRHSWKRIVFHAYTLCVFWRGRGSQCKMNLARFVISFEPADISSSSSLFHSLLSGEDGKSLGFFATSSGNYA